MLSCKWCGVTSGVSQSAVQGPGRPLVWPPGPAHSGVRTVTESGPRRKLWPSALVAGCERCLELGATRSSPRYWGNCWGLSHHTSFLTRCSQVSALLGLPTQSRRGGVSLDPRPRVPNPSSLSPVGASCPLPCACPQLSCGHCVSTPCRCLHRPWNATRLPAGHLVRLAHSLGSCLVEGILATGVRERRAGHSQSQGLQSVPSSLG